MHSKTVVHNHCLSIYPQEACLKQGSYLKAILQNLILHCRGGIHTLHAVITRTQFAQPTHTPRQEEGNRRVSSCKICCKLSSSQPLKICSVQDTWAHLCHYFQQHLQAAVVACTSLYGCTSLLPAATAHAVVCAAPDSPPF